MFSITPNVPHGETCCLVTEELHTHSTTKHDSKVVSYSRPAHPTGCTTTAELHTPAVTLGRQHTPCQCFAFHTLSLIMTCAACLMTQIDTTGST